MTVTIGIDPGKDGAIARVVDGVLTEYVLTRHLLHKNVFVAEAMAEALRSLVSRSPVSCVVIERVGAMPKQGLSSTFGFGYGAGIWRGCIAAIHGGRVLEPTPTVWTRAMFRDTPGEGKSRGVCRALVVPGFVVPIGCRVHHSGLADAVCLALYGST